VHYAFCSFEVDPTFDSSDLVENVSEEGPQEGLQPEEEKKGPEFVNGKRMHTCSNGISLITITTTNERITTNESITENDIYGDEDEFPMLELNTAKKFNKVKTKNEKPTHAVACVKGFQMTDLGLVLKNIFGTTKYNIRNNLWKRSVCFINLPDMPYGTLPDDVKELYEMQGVDRNLKPATLIVAVEHATDRCR
jgi:hypothetical protein